MKENKFENFFDKVFLAGRRPYYWLAGIIFLLYCSTLFLGLTRMDDVFLLSNASWLLAQPHNIVGVFFHNLYGNGNFLLPYYRPILALSFLPDIIFGLANSIFIAHFINIVIHTVAVYLLFILLQKLLYSRRASFLAALLFAVHPVLTQAVAWIPGRNDSLLALFVLASFIFLIDFLDKQKTIDYIWHALFLVLALFTKESAIGIIPAAVFFTFFIKKIPLLSRRTYLLCATWFLASLALLGLRTLALKSDLYHNTGEWISLHNWPAIIQYIGKIFFPVNLSTLPLVQDSTFIYGLVSLMILLLFFFLSRRLRLNYITFGLIWFLSFLLPAVLFTVNRNNIDYQMEQRLYLPLVGILIILLEINIFERLKIKKLFFYILYAMVIIVFLGIAFWHNFVFLNDISFFKNAVKYSPKLAAAHRNLAMSYHLDGRFDEAEKEYKTAIELSPNVGILHGNLGRLYCSENMYQQAEAEFNKQIELDPYSNNAYSNLGSLYYRQNMIEAAVAAYEKAQKVSPSEATEQMLLNLHEQQKFDEINKK